MPERKYICQRCVLLQKPLPAQKCPGCRKLKADEWYRSHKDQYRTWCRKYRNENPEKVADSRRKYENFMRANPSYRKKRHESDMNWRRNNRDIYYARQLRYRTRHRDRWLEQRACHYAKKNYGLFAPALRALLQLKREIGEMK